MPKKIAHLASILAASAFIAGCSNTVKDNTLKAIQLSPSVQGTPMVAELDVAHQKVLGQAKGKSLFKTELEKEAVAEALRQVNGDVLVGANYFYEYNDSHMSVTVIGYPAYYKNFKPKEVCEVNNDVLIGGNFSYEDGSKNNVQVTIKNPKPATATPAPQAAPVAPAAPIAPIAPPPPAPPPQKPAPVAPKAAPIAPAPQPIPAAPIAPAPQPIPVAPAPQPIPGVPIAPAPQPVHP